MKIRGKGICLTAALILSGVLVSGAAAITQDFSGVPAGTVVAGTLPAGGTSPGTVFPDFTLTVQNDGAGPQSAIIFNTASPTGGDWDLGTPNEVFGGPGIGSGGESGPGVNDVPLGNAIIIAANITDLDMDDLVDDPNDDEGGGWIRFDFNKPTVVMWFRIVDIDESESITFRCYDGTTLVGEEYSMPYGNNCAQKVDLMNLGALTHVDAVFSGSGAIAEIEYRPETSNTKETSWGDVKKLWR